MPEIADPQPVYGAFRAAVLGQPLTAGFQSATIFFAAQFTGLLAVSALATGPNVDRMSRNYYSEIHLHIVWHTKESSPILVPELEKLVDRELQHKIVLTPGAFVREIGGTETHVHVAVSLAPTIAISEFIGQLKGASAHEVNERLNRKVIHWQAGYGVVSFGTKDLPWVVDYIRHQKEHHARGTTRERLERISPEDAGRAMAEAEQREAP